MKLDRELKHKSEDIQDAVLMDVVSAIRRRVRFVNRNYDIPYIAGYSRDGRTVFIDRHLPRTFRWLMKTVRVEPFLMTREIVEKALLRLHYLHAHQVAVRTSRPVSGKILMPRAVVFLPVDPNRSAFLI
jgi:hypothetical protein